MQFHTNSFAQIESDLTLRDSDKSLISNISCTKQLTIIGRGWAKYRGGTGGAKPFKN